MIDTSVSKNIDINILVLLISFFFYNMLLINILKNDNRVIQLNVMSVLLIIYMYKYIYELHTYNNDNHNKYFDAGFDQCH